MSKPDALKTARNIWIKRQQMGKNPNPFTDPQVMGAGRGQAPGRGNPAMGRGRGGPGPQAGRGRGAPGSAGRGGGPGQVVNGHGGGIKWSQIP